MVNMCWSLNLSRWKIVKCIDTTVASIADVRIDGEAVHAIVHGKITCGSVSSPHMKHSAQVVNV